MDHLVFPKLPKFNVEGCKDPKSKIWALLDENWPFYSHLLKVPLFMDHPVFLKLSKSNVEGCKDPKSNIWALSDENYSYYSHPLKVPLLWNTLYFQNSENPIQFQNLSSLRWKLTVFWTLGINLHHSEPLCAF